MFVCVCVCVCPFPPKNNFAPLLRVVRALFHDGANEPCREDVVGTGGPTLESVFLSSVPTWESMGKSLQDHVNTNTELLAAFPCLSLLGFHRPLAFFYSCCLASPYSTKKDEAFRPGTETVERVKANRLNLIYQDQEVGILSVIPNLRQNEAKRPEIVQHLSFWVFMNIKFCGF